MDSSRFCGDVVAVLSLLSPAVAKFVHTEEKDHVSRGRKKKRGVNSRVERK